jgi:Txe/YoeB family toxin of Txe-Axe toxin-antitoxin module
MSIKEKLTDFVKRPITDMQKEFIRLYVESDGQLSKTECARLAGYETNSAYQRAYELTNPKIYPNVVAEIGRYKQEYAEKYNITFDNHKQILAKIRDKALEKEMFGVAGRMEELRGKLMGYYVDKQLNVNKNSYDDMTPEQLEERMKKIVDDYDYIFKPEDEKNEQKPEENNQK